MDTRFREEKEMESNGNSRGGLLSAGGVLSIIAGILQIISVASSVAYVFFPDWLYQMLDTTLSPLRFVPFILTYLFQFIQYASGGGLESVLVPVVAGALAIVAIVGGVSAIRRNSFGLSLAGAICVLPSGILGILALVFIVLGRKEFRAKVKEDGVQ
jgi:hypothetical protein